MKNVIQKAAAVLTALATVVITQQAGAIGVTFNFRVNSSGPSIYPCNAGLLTPNDNPKVCYIAGTSTRCTPTCVGDACDPQTPPPPPPALFGMSLAGGPPPPTPPTNPPENSCVCTTTQGDSYANYFDASYHNWDETGDPTLHVASGIDSFNKLFNEPTAYGKTLQNLTINLGNELYNAQYFVDICYRAPQIDYRGIDTSWDLYGKVSVTDFGYQNGSSGYKTLSDLHAKAYVICDLQRDTCPTCNDADPVTDTSAAIFSEGNDFLKATGSGAARYDFSYQTGAITSLPSSLTEVFNIHDAFKNLGKSAPRFCKIRYVFSENNGLSAQTAILRKWQKHGAQVCTYSQIEATGITPHLMSHK
jgi:hypothetical protein